MLNHVLLKVNFRTKLALVFVTALLLSAVSVGYFSYYSARNVVRKDQRKALAEITNLMIMGIDARIGALGRQMELVAGSAQIEAYTSALPAAAGPELKEYYEAMQNAFGFVNAVYIVKDERLYLPTENESMPLGAAACERLRRTVEKTPDGVVWEGVEAPLGPEPDPPPARKEHVIRAVRAIGAADGGSRPAILVLELKAREFDNVLLSNRASLSYQYRMIFDQNRRLVAANRGLDEKTTAAMLARYDGGERGFTLETAHTNYFVQGQYDGLTGWSVFSAQEVASAFASGDELVRLIVQFVLVSSLLASLSVIFLSGTITRPIKSLSKAMGRFEKGDFSVRLRPRGSDEMGRLMQSFNYMADEIDTLIHQVYGVRLAQQEAEIAALEAQINPHFLYNTLDSIQWVLLREGQVEIARVVVALGKILRYSVDGRQRTVTLDSELQYAEDYLSIQKYRLEDRLCYDVDVPAELGRCFVPRLILQPLIENAIVHGVEGTLAATIEISARREDDRLIVRVRDYGKGMDDDELARIRGEIESESPSTHLGLRNVHRRLLLQFGPAYGLHIEAEAERGCLVTLTLPLLWENEAPPAAGRKRPGGAMAAAGTETFDRPGEAERPD